MIDLLLSAGTTEAGHSNVPLYLAGILSLGLAAQWMAWRIKIPAIVLLLLFGFLFGIATGPPNEVISDSVLLPLVSLAVGVILFEGGLSLKLSEVHETGGVVIRLVTIGLVVTWLGTAAAAHYLMDFSWRIAILLGALLTVSGPTVIVPMLRQVRPKKRIGSLIKWEGIVNDPIGAVLAALVFEVVRFGNDHSAGGGVMAGESLWNLGMTLAVGLSIGGVAAIAIVIMLSRFLAPDYLQNPLILAIVIMVFAISNYVQHESGLVTVTFLGLLLANQHVVTVKHVVEFKENLTVLLISVLFIVLSARVEIGWAELQGIGWGGVALLATMLFVIRPIAAGLATMGSDLSWQERLLLCWIHPRGIVAAAVASLLAIRFVDTPGEAEAEKLVLVTFLVIVGTVTIYGLTLKPLAKWLGLAGDEPQGVLFVGASPMVREIALALQSEGFDTVVVDSNRENITEARMAGLPVIYGSIGSEVVHDEIDLGAIGRLAAMTPNDEVNSLATTEFGELFGTANVYELDHQVTSERHERVPQHNRGRTLFAEDVTYDELERRFAAGAAIKKTPLGEDFTIEDFRTKYPGALILFTVPEPGQLTISVAGRKLEPKPGKKIIALVDSGVMGDSGVLS